MATPAPSPTSPQGGPAGAKRSRRLCWLWSIAGTVVLCVPLLVLVGRTWFIHEGSPRLPQEVTPSRPKPKGELLVGIREGATEQEVRKVLGPPDEIRKLPADGILDGMRIASDQPPYDTEVVRWAYGVKKPSTFARTGIVSFDKNQRVIIARSPVLSGSPPRLFLFSEVRPAVDSGGMVCRLDSVVFQEADRGVSRFYHPKFTLINTGKSEYTFQYDTVSTSFLVFVEIYGPDKELIFRENRLSYRSPSGLDEKNWPIMRIATGESRPGSAPISPGEYFGALPPGQYYMRVSFPFKNWEYTPSDLLPFRVPDHPEPGKSKEPE